MTVSGKTCAGGCGTEGTLRLAIPRGADFACTDCVGGVLAQMLLVWPRIVVTAVKP